MKDQIQKLIEIALAEDIGGGDITSLAIADKKSRVIGKIKSKQQLILAGIDVAGCVFRTLDPDISWDPQKKDGESCMEGDVIAEVEGSAGAILSGERTALNFLQHLSGIATLTNRFVEVIRGTKVTVLDTRKTTPGLRALEKHAVKMGGGTNHRMGLFDHFLIKDNHINIAGSVTKAIELAARAKRLGQLIEVETRNMTQVREAIEGGVDVIMLDNMSPNEVREAVELINGRCKIEVSGNITLENIASYAATGVDFISVGAITHSAPAVDVNMTIIELVS